MARPIDPFSVHSQAPVILMSQNGQAAKDRLDAPHDYEVNLKAELEVMALHTKQGWREASPSPLSLPGGGIPKTDGCGSVIIRRE